MQKRIHKSIIFIMLIMLAFTLTGCGSNSGSPVAVSTYTAKQDTMELPLILSGVLTAGQTASISSQITGQVVQLGFAAGDVVKEGDLLVQLDTKSLEGQLLAAQASLQSAQAAAAASNNQSYLAKISLDAAQKNYDRVKQLYDAGAASALQMEDAQDKLNTASKQYENASGPALDQAQAAINSAAANIKGYEIQIAKSSITSPINGIISSQSVNVGEVVSVGVPVISIIDNSQLKLKCTVGQDDLSLLSHGQSVQIAVDGYPNLDLTGTITSVGPMAVSTGEVFPVEITLDNDGNLMTGMSAHATLVTKVQGIIVPASAVVQNDGETVVFVTDGQQASKRIVKTGLKNDTFIQILEGLNEGDQVIVSNAGALADNTRVKIQ
jgi:RND family efflux transporter, MFP subunit